MACANGNLVSEGASRLDAFSADPDLEREHQRQTLIEEFQLNPINILWTKASTTGSSVLVD